MADFYNPKEVEEKFYKIWEDRGYFEIDGNKDILEKDKKFCIMMPPPNVTGVLHIGHALTFTLQDIMTRYKRMDGYKVLWQPGLDHAGIATQNVVEKQLLANGATKEKIGREEFLKKTWEWKEKSGGTIVHQMRRLGITPAWSRERFTMDAGLKNAVRKAFVNLYNKGLIVRGNYMVNWCTHDGALSDVEVEHKANKGKLYHIKYPIVDSDKFIIVATTRPETYFGDTAVMVNPNDERYKELVGKFVTLPIINRRIQIIADDHVDMDFGTGIVKVTPAHDTNDYEVGNKHGLEFITVFDEKGILNEQCGEFEGLERLEARDKVVAKLESLGFVEKIEDYENQVGYCYRCKNVVEPYISKQWFVKADIANEAIQNVNDGGAEFFPSHWINSFNAWMRELKDWCISRQLWWGHQIPVFYCECGHEWADENEKPLKCPKCGGNKFTQDKDVLDTWFSSGLWPISTLGWGNGDALKNEKWFDGDLSEFYPNTMLITGFDILFFWVARMMFQCDNATNKLPFKDIYLHALVKDKDGKKMSKSSGNVIDPLTKIDEYSADILRFTLTLLCVQGRDIRLSEEKMVLVRNFTNKLYNASKFLLLNADKFPDFDENSIKTELGRYMLSRFKSCVNSLRSNLDIYRFNDAANDIYKFLWDEFCDWGIELSKVDKSSVIELGMIFKESMKLLSPFMPFISEYLYHELSGTNLENSRSIMVMKYPKITTPDQKIVETWSAVIEAIVSLRRAKATIDQGNAKVQKAYIKFNNKIDINGVTNYIKLLAKCEEIELTDEIIPNSARDVSENLESFIPLAGVDTTAIIARLNSQKSKLEKEIAKLENMLNNEKFVANAPEAVLRANREGLATAKAKFEKVIGELKNLNNV
ncbi:valyl-tRNA synthetase [Campylobacter hyointestinalis]|uniref:valine--tRNA ligase n=1 Tax=Campylobacter hyointestinalis TaxID=198 RepID=UPI0004D66D0A|nr:valine--tRNA ligase [Campylobacter hyointestinalis]ANE32481.1 valyl-tRNA synthetase [Campylobacter hyointestinalis subsp. hyointestinalis LMG 9260]KEA45172.1 valyl-tRNA synthetase [Campylobacter hyointestinalis subsp. hyointestinalis]QKF55644.1 valyl-tRNA synthetase [Campylobacter hyointestinalis subsp. hyointestinalis]TXK48522.1 valine--tRNA ligase [Campylobacter hyointestinalis]SFT33207.1 valyl-tRNA synthetase [Campylobacter hyointestinalis]